MNRSRPPHPMALMRARAALGVGDVQERLVHAMDADRREEVMRNIKALTTSAAASSALHVTPGGTSHEPRPGKAHAKLVPASEPR